MKLTKKQIKAVVRYLKSIEQPTTAKQFKKDWSKKKIKEVTEPKGECIEIKGTLLILDMQRQIRNCKLIISNIGQTKRYEIVVDDKSLLDGIPPVGVPYFGKFFTPNKTYNVSIYHTQDSNVLIGTGALTIEDHPNYEET